MPTYEYECINCGHRFEIKQSMSDKPISECPQCGGTLKRLISGGMGFILKGSNSHPPYKRQGKECNFETTGKTCCGRSEPCGKCH